ncbi:MAG: MotA/TolQ/ExbB proton channel family protein [Thermoanaerobaculia bacterium]
MGQLVTYFKMGGIVMWPLLFFSLATIVVFIERLITYHRLKVNTRSLLMQIRKALLEDRNADLAVRVCEKHRGPVAAVLKAGILKYGKPKEEIEKTIEAAAVYEMARIEKRLMWLATSANVSPMLGFLGTVTGMIKSFDALAKVGLSNPGLVAAGISEALITTAFGLFIAIPAQIFYNYFMSRVNKFVHDIEASANILMETFDELQRGGN